MSSAAHQSCHWCHEEHGDAEQRVGEDVRGDCLSHAPRADQQQ